MFDSLRRSVRVDGTAEAFSSGLRLASVEHVFSMQALKYMVILLTHGDGRNCNGHEQEHDQHPRKHPQEVWYQGGGQGGLSETSQGLMLLRVPPLKELFGSGSAHKDELIQSVRELEAEHRREAAE